VRRFKIFINYDEEEKWLNSMLKRGYELKSKQFGYKFQHVEPQDNTIRVDYRTFKTSKDFIDYCYLFQDSGWKHIAGTKSSGAQYFKRIGENSEEDIFSDNKSKVERYKREANAYMLLALVFIPIFFSILGKYMYININSFYHTPGLWQRSGIPFWGGFLFETPFAFCRGFVYFGIPMILIFALYFSIGFRILYYKTDKNKY